MMKIVNVRIIQIKKFLIFQKEKNLFILIMKIFQNVKQIIFQLQNQRKNHLIRKKGIIENNEFNDFNNNNINIWKILFLFLVNLILITLIFINEYINMKNRIINSIIPNKKNLKIQYCNYEELNI